MDKRTVVSCPPSSLPVAWKDMMYLIRFPFVVLVQQVFFLQKIACFWLKCQITQAKITRSPNGTDGWVAQPERVGSFLLFFSKDL